MQENTNERPTQGARAAKNKAAAQDEPSARRKRDRRAASTDDDVEATAPSRELAQRTIELFRKVSARLDKTRELPDDFPRPEQPLSFQIAAPLPLTLDFKQELLENRSESERLRLLNRGIARLIRQIDQVEKARTKAGGNGKLRST